ncbi:MAG: hypothetical protein J7L11_02825 [Thermoprotei archaeon]|nr:hypothetical protein [Thermoprotei archaeon]
MRRGSGVTPIEGKGDDMPPMNPRGGLSLMNPKGSVDQTINAYEGLSNLNP